MRSTSNSGDIHGLLIYYHGDTIWMIFPERFRRPFREILQKKERFFTWFNHKVTICLGSLTSASIIFVAGKSTTGFIIWPVGRWWTDPWGSHTLENHGYPTDDAQFTRLTCGCHWGDSEVVTGFIHTIYINYKRKLLLWRCSLDFESTFPRFNL